MRSGRRGDESYWGGVRPLAYWHKVQARLAKAMSTWRTVRATRSLSAVVMAGSPNIVGDKSRRGREWPKGNSRLLVRLMNPDKNK